MSNPTCRQCHTTSARGSHDYIEAKKSKQKQQTLGAGETFLCEAAERHHPEWQEHPRKMWGAVDKREAENPRKYDKDGNEIKPRCATKLIIALPMDDGVTDEMQADMCRELAETFRKQGRSGQWRIHKDKGNYHAHFELTDRQMDIETGEWVKAKIKREPVLDANGKKIQETERILDENNNYIKDANGNFVTQPKFRKNSAGRKIAVYKYRKIDGYDWDSKEYLQHNIRDAWENIQNKYLKQIGAPECSLKTLKEQQTQQEIPQEQQQLSTMHEGHEPEKEDSAAHKKWEERVIFNEERRTENDRRAEILRRGEKIYDTDDPELRAIREYLEADSLATAGSNEKEGRENRDFDYTKFEIAARVDASARALDEAGRSAGDTERLGNDTRELEQRIRDLLAAEERERTTPQGLARSQTRSSDSEIER